MFVFLSYWSNSTGLTDTTASNSSFLTALYCVIIPFLLWAVSKKKPTRFNIVAALVCVVGVGLVSFSGATDFSVRFGDAITLLSALFLSFHVVYTAKFARGSNMMILTIIQFITAGLLGFAAGIAFEPLPAFASLGMETYVSLAYLIVFASCIALLLQNIAIAHVDPAPASLFLATESVFGVAFSIIFLGETMTVPLLFGFGLIFAGIIISEYLPLRAEKKAQKQAFSAIGGTLHRVEHPVNPNHQKEPKNPKNQPLPKHPDR